MTRQKINDFFAVLNWMPSEHGLRSDSRYGTAAPSWLTQEGFAVTAAYAFGTMALVFSVVIFARSLIVITLGTPEKGATVSEMGLILAIALICFLLSVCAARKLFSRKVSNHQFEAMQQWHKRIDGLPSPQKDMTKKDLAAFMDKVYEQESIRRKEFCQNSLLNV